MSLASNQRLLLIKLLIWYLAELLKLKAKQLKWEYCWPSLLMEDIKKLWVIGFVVFSPKGKKISVLGKSHKAHQITKPSL